MNEAEYLNCEELWRSRRVLSVKAIGHRPRRVTPSEISKILHKNYDMKVEFNNCFIILSK